MNKVILLGRLTRDPEVRYGGADNQTAIARFTLAVDRRFKRASDTVEADFLNCTAIGKLGEFTERYLKQGTKILLTGRIENDNYTNRDGQKVYSLRIIAEEMEFAESKGSGSASAPVGGGAATPAEPRQEAPAENPGFQDVAPMQNRNDSAPGGFMNIPDGVEDSELPFN